MNPLFQPNAPSNWKRHGALFIGLYGPQGLHLGQSPALLTAGPDWAAFPRTPERKEKRSCTTEPMI